MTKLNENRQHKKSRLTLYSKDPNLEWSVDPWREPWKYWKIAIFLIKNILMCQKEFFYQSTSIPGGGNRGFSVSETVVLEFRTPCNVHITVNTWKNLRIRAGPNKFSLRPRAVPIVWLSRTILETLTIVLHVDYREFWGKMAAFLMCERFSLFPAPVRTARACINFFVHCPSKHTLR